MVIATGFVTSMHRFEAFLNCVHFHVQSGDISNTLAVAEEIARTIRPGTVFLDLNSASPGTKQKAASLIEAAGGKYVDAGVMTSVPPYGLAVPMWVGGRHAAALADRLRTFGFDITPVSEKIGIASATKMSRSIMIKGLEALGVPFSD